MKRFVQAFGCLMLFTSTVGCHHFCGCGRPSLMDRLTYKYANCCDHHADPFMNADGCQACQEGQFQYGVQPGEVMAPGRLQPMPDPTYQNQQYPPTPEPAPEKAKEGEPHTQPPQEAVQKRSDKQVLAPAALLVPPRVEPTPIKDSRQIDYDAPARL